MNIRSTVSGRVKVPGLLLSVLVSIAPAAVAQVTSDPFNPWNSQYEAYTYPSYPGGTGVYPGQAAFEVPTGIRGSNRMSDFIEDDLTDGERGRSAGTFRRGIGVPYTRAYRQYDRQYGRTYMPNENADEGFNSTRQQRDEAYTEYRTAKDPEERARLRKEYDYYNRQTLRELMSGGRQSRPARSSGSAAGIPGVSGRTGNYSSPAGSATTGRRTAVPGLPSTSAGGTSAGSRRGSATRSQLPDFLQRSLGDSSSASSTRSSSAGTGTANRSGRGFGEPRSGAGLTAPGNSSALGRMRSAPSAADILRRSRGMDSRRSSDSTPPPSPTPGIEP